MFPGRKENDSLLIKWLWVLSSQPLIAVALTTVHCKQSKWKNRLPESQSYGGVDCARATGETESVDQAWGSIVPLTFLVLQFPCWMAVMCECVKWICSQISLQETIIWTAPELALTIVPGFPVLGNKINYSLVTEARRSSWLWKTIQVEQCGEVHFIDHMLLLSYIFLQLTAWLWRTD